MLFLVAALLLAGIYLVVRPMLRGLPQLKAFYDRADTVEAKLWAVTWNSATVAWSYILAALGFLSTQLEPIAAALGDPQLQAQLSNLIGADTRTLGVFMLIVSFITFAARMRSILRG